MLLMSTKSSSPIMFILVVLLLVTIGCWILFRKKRPEKHSTNILLPESFKGEFILTILKYFSDDMNNLLNIVKGKTDLDGASITFENIGQIIEGHGSEEFKDWYNSFVKDRNTWNLSQYSKKANILLAGFKKCGIQPSEEESIIWDEQSSTRYIKLTAVSLGQRCEVVAPMWVYKGEVFEKGLVKVTE